MRLLWCVLLVAAAARAGGGPETTLVVVNQASPISRRIANEYIALRGVPESHVVWLDSVPSLGVISLEDFRDRIWTPIREFLVTEKLDAEIDLVAYSAGFPYAVDLSAFQASLTDERPPFISRSESGWRAPSRGGSSDRPC